jgi:hypothetical protein
MNSLADTVERSLLDKNPYKAIELWHTQTGSRAYYILNRQMDAKRANAPLDAIYFHQDSKKWICVSDLARDHKFVTDYEHMMHSRRQGE